MAIVYSSHFTYERNFFPSLTDKEFEVMVLYCQLMNLRKVANHLCRSERVVSMHLNSCKNKLGVSGDYDLYFLFVCRVMHFEQLFPKLPPECISLLVAYFFDPNISVIARNLGMERKEAKQKLLYIQGELGLKDFSSMRMMFFMKGYVFT